MTPAEAKSGSGATGRGLVGTVVLLGALPALLTAGCQAGGASANRDDKIYSQAETIPFQVSFDGQVPVHRPESARRLKVVNGPTATLEKPVSSNAVVALVKTDDAPLPLGMNVEVLELDDQDKICAKPWSFSVPNPRQGEKLQGAVPGRKVAVVVYASWPDGTRNARRVRLNTLPADQPPAPADP